MSIKSSQLTMSILPSMLHDKDGNEPDFENEHHAWNVATMLSQVRAQGVCTKLIHLNGKAGASELCMMAGLYGKRGICALVNDKGNFAYVVFENGKVMEGSFHQLAEGFSLS